MKKSNVQKQDTHVIVRAGGALRLFRSFILVATCLAGKAAFSQKKYVKSVECFGKQSTHSVIFLHGIDTPSKPDADNLSAYQTMKKLADDLQFSLALPRSNNYCQQGRKVCWNVAQQATDLKKIYQEIIEKSARCFKQNSKAILVGFSNGGYFLNKLLHHCILSKESHVISIGAAGSTRHRNSLSACGQLDLVLGKYESTYQSGVSYYKAIKKANGKSKLTIFNGGHMVPYEPLHTILHKHLKKF